MRRRLLALSGVLGIALGGVAPSAAAVDCGQIEVHPAEHTSPAGLTLRTTRSSVVEHPMPGTWHIRTCHVVVNPSGGAAASDTFDVSWSSGVPVASASLGNGSASAPPPDCSAPGSGFGSVGASALAGGDLTVECCLLAPISTGGCSAGDPGCTCDDPGQLVANGAVVASLQFDARVPKSGGGGGGSSGGCGLVGLEALGVWAFVRRLKRADRRRA